MSRKLVSLVYERRVGSVHRKAVLAYLADCASDNGKGIWASKQTIANETECGRSTVIKIIGQFLSEGVLVEVGSRPCRNGVTVVYDLNVEAISAFPKTKNEPVYQRDPSTSGTSLDMDPSTSGTPPVHQRDPMGSTSGTLTTREPLLNQKEEPNGSSKKEAPQLILSAWASTEAAESFVAYRKKIRKPLTATGAERLAKGLKEIFNRQHDPSDALAMAEERGWQTVRPDWYFREVEQNNERNHYAPQSRAPNRNRRGPHHNLMVGFAAVADQE